MLSIEEQKKIIEKSVRANKNFKGNEDLFEDFCSESLQKSYMIFNSVSNVQKIESYISKVVHTSVLSVLKDYGRVRRTNNHYTAVKETKISDFSNTADESKDSSYKDYKEDYHQEEDNLPVKREISSSFILELPDPRESAEDVLITKECLRKIADAVCVIHKEVPSQMFFELFHLRYIKGLKQAEIGKELNLSQSEVSKRLMRLSKLISNILDGNRKQVK